MNKHKHSFAIPQSMVGNVCYFVQPAEQEMN